MSKCKSMYNRFFFLPSSLTFSLYLKPDQPVSYSSEDLPHGDVYSLDSNHSHFILVEEDPKKPGATNDMRVKMLKHISLQRTGHGGICKFVPIVHLERLTRP